MNIPFTDGTECTLPDMDERIERLAIVLYGDSAAPTIVGEQLRSMLSDVFPELFDGSHWLAPWESTHEMHVAGFNAQDILGDDWAAMRDAYLAHIKSQGGE